MLVEQAVEDLKKYAEDFTKVGDAQQAINANKDEFIHKWAKVMQYYKYICDHCEALSKEFLDAVDILADIACENPSLKEWVEQIIHPEKKQVQSQTKENIDTSALSSRIDSLVSEIKNMRSWDPDEIGDIEWQLQECQKMLVSNQNAFSSNAYQSLMSDINMALGKIDSFNKMLNSDVMQSMKI